VRPPALRIEQPGQGGGRLPLPGRKQQARVDRGALGGRGRQAGLFAEVVSQIVMQVVDQQKHL